MAVAFVYMHNLPSLTSSEGNFLALPVVVGICRCYHLTRCMWFPIRDLQWYNT